MDPQLSDGSSREEPTRDLGSRDALRAETRGDVRRTEPDLTAEAALVASAQAGDHDAFRALYEQYVRLVYSFIVSRVGPSVADDLTAETFARAYENLAGFEWRGVSIRAWLLRIAYHQIVGRSRRRSTSEVVTDELEPPQTESHEHLVVEQLTTGSDLLEALASLPSTQRAAVELRYLRELSVPETAVVLEMTEEAVRALTYRSLRALRALLTPPADTGSP